MGMACCQFCAMLVSSEADRDVCNAVREQNQHVL
jgi:hypothetical protein